MTICVATLENLCPIFSYVTVMRVWEKIKVPSIIWKEIVNAGHVHLSYAYEQVLQHFKVRWRSFAMTVLVITLYFRVLPLLHMKCKTVFSNALQPVQVDVWP
jgi:hypothetical protein